MTPTVEILADKAALIDRASELMIATLKDAIAARGRATVALSGGSTPKPLYTSLISTDLPRRRRYFPK
ncbi:MAG: 6-phosphogluconolactonase, partial [Cyanobacteria bacterium J06554_3]